MYLENQKKKKKQKSITSNKWYEQNSRIQDKFIEIEFSISEKTAKKLIHN